MTNIPSKDKSHYTPLNPDKYKGKYPIGTRSSYETKFCKGADQNSQVLYGTSEPIDISYFDPVKQKQRRYFPDYVIKTIDKTTRLEKIWLIEIKPGKECVPPVPSKGKSKKTKLHESVTFATNKAKGLAAQRYCKSKGWHFKLITERELF